MRTLFFLVSFFIASVFSAQTYTDEEKLQGYALENDHVIFLFEPLLYNVNPSKVNVTGSFRNWDQDMNNKNWIMKKENNIWTLNVSNKEFKSVAPDTEFKFRIDDGKWLSPPANVQNEKGGNLVFLKDVVIPGLKAVILGPYSIRAIITGGRSLLKEDYRVIDAAGNEIKISSILPNTSTETLISTSEPMDIKRVYFLEVPKQGLKTFCSYD